MSGFVAVHVGAGYHRENLRPKYKKTCKTACYEATEMLQDGCNAVEAVTRAISVLEDCPLTNAGIGSNLTDSGTVECDASLMDGASFNFGSVGALSNIKNPIQVAKAVLEQQNKGLLSLGRIPPCTIVGKKALDWALQRKFNYADNKELVSKGAKDAYTKCLFQQMSASSSRKLNSSPDIKKPMLLDTVGAICVDSFGNVSSAVSSGGLLFKVPGRIGQSSIYGSGCWAQNSAESYRPSVACTVSGTGEYIIKTLFAKECYRKLYQEHDCISALPDLIKEQFLNSPYLKNVESKHKLIGVLSLKHYVADNFCEVAWAHNTPSMVLGYESTRKRKPIAIVSEQLVNKSTQDKECIMASENVNNNRNLKQINEECIVASEKLIKLNSGS
ncbi:threonine aspartase 1 [Caerostris darwini]|uniref:Threonine aspartase 1 n=1 Tax=Caerostris darwini TaxID=1538125 RepID=A0AAV4TZT6_9ARAC|nr:threonine aspartase 1 [Caerostris darwini]